MTLPKVELKLELSTERITAMSNLGEYVSSLQINLPKNREGLPLEYVDPQILAETGFLDKNPNVENLDVAIIKLNYSEGFPTVDGMPFWERLDGETLPFYELFKQYRNQIDLNIRRSIISIAESLNISSKFLYGLSRAYHWRQRAKAYDAYKIQKIELERNRNIQLMENKHHSAATKLFDLCMEHIDKNFGYDDKEENLLKILSPKDIRELLEVAIKLERLSLGQHPDKPLISGDQSVVNAIVTNYPSSTNQSPEVPAEIESKKQLQNVVNILFSSGALDDAISKKLENKNAKSIKAMKGVANG